MKKNNKEWVMFYFVVMIIFAIWMIDAFALWNIIF